MNSPLQVGVTGGIGSGKSTVCKVFQTLGIPIYEADTRAKWLMNTDDKLKKAIIERYGNKAYAEGELNRPFLAEKVFSDPEEVAYLNSLVHPCVAEDYQAWVAGHADKPYVIREAAIMLEAGYSDQLDVVINVAASPEVREHRTLLRDAHRTERQVRSIMEQQLSEEARKEKATYTIRNEGDEMLLPRLLKLHDQILARLAT